MGTSGVGNGFSVSIEVLINGYKWCWKWVFSDYGWC